MCTAGSLMWDYPQLDVVSRLLIEVLLGVNSCVIITAIAVIVCMLKVCILIGHIDYLLKA